jgi:hypothetical protein
MQQTTLSCRAQGLRMYKHEICLSRRISCSTRTALKLLSNLELTEERTYCPPPQSFAAAANYSNYSNEARKDREGIKSHIKSPDKYVKAEMDELGLDISSVCVFLFH